tara:strand:- start:2976 stop:4001 length:1026 start_codon:yes stop_codon:yes gene_type:complete
MTVDLSEAINSFDILSYLNDVGVNYKESGKNIGKGSIGICCPLCGDDNFHMGINLDKKFYNCWRCGDYDSHGRGSLFGLIYLLEGLNKKSAFRRIMDYSDVEVLNEYEDDVYASLEKVAERWEKRKLESVTEIKRKSEVAIEGKYKLLSELNENLLSEKMFLSYVKKRNFNINELSEWGVTAYVSGKFQGRLVFPIYQNSKIVNYTGRDVTGNAEAKYLNCSNDEAIVPMKELLFGSEYVKTDKDYLILVEGPMDVIRVGKGLAVGSMGLILTEIQKETLYQLKPKRLLVMFDSGAWIEAEKIKMELGVFIDNITVIVLPDKKDPADLEKHEMKSIINSYI